VTQALRHWLSDPDLAGVPDEGAIAQRPEAEREACRKLWDDVDALLKRVEPKPKTGPDKMTPGQPRR
jgi:hypothetical protein